MNVALGMVIGSIIAVPVTRLFSSDVRVTIGAAIGTCWSVAWLYFGGHLQ